MYQLSIVIPARNEEFLPQTVEDLLKHTSDKTEVLVGLDGYDIELPTHPRLRVHKEAESIGQRAMQNRLVEMSTAKYVAKTDAHCAFDDDFDTKMLAKMEDNITLVPVMRNLHVFDWKCDFCDWRGYQGPKPQSCPECHSDASHIEKQIIWNPKTNPQSSAYRFNKNLQFKYFPELRAKLPREGLQESMSLQGSFFMCTRDKYWSLKLCDESWGSWGQQGSEVALKTWLSGGRVLVNFDTWYGHLFRTQQGFSFPYPMNGNDQDRARKISRDLFLNDKWDKAIHPLSWLLEKFWFALKDVSDGEAKWEESDLTNYKQPISREIIYYTAHQKSLKVSKAVQNKLKEISKQKDIPIRSVSLKPMDKMGENIHLPLEPGVLTYFTQVITALRHSKAEIVYMCEDDALYHESHFDYIPDDDKFHYNLNWWRVRPDGFAVHWDANQVSGLVARREPLLAWYKQKYDDILKKGFDRSYEPGGRHSDAAQFRSAAPYIDLRTGNTMTKDKWSLDDFRDKSTAQNFQTSTIENIPGWDYDTLKKVLEN